MDAHRRRRRRRETGTLNTETISQTYVPWMQVSDGMIADNVVGIMRSLRVALRGEVEPTALTDTVHAPDSGNRFRLAGDVRTDDE